MIPLDSRPANTPYISNIIIVLYFNDAAKKNCNSEMKILKLRKLKWMIVDCLIRPLVAVTTFGTRDER